MFYLCVGFVLLSDQPWLRVSPLWHPDQSEAAQLAHFAITVLRSALLALEVLTTVYLPKLPTVKVFALWASSLDSTVQKVRPAIVARLQIYNEKYTHPHSNV